MFLSFDVRFEWNKYIRNIVVIDLCINGRCPKSRLALPTFACVGGNDRETIENTLKVRL